MAPAWPTVAAEAVERVARQPAPSWSGPAGDPRNATSSTPPPWSPRPSRRPSTEGPRGDEAAARPARHGRRRTDPGGYAWAACARREKRKRERWWWTIGDSQGKATGRAHRAQRASSLLENGASASSPRRGGGDQGQPSSAPPRARSRRGPAPSPEPPQPRSQPARPEAENRYALDREAVETPCATPTDILSQARFLPKYDGGQMMGFQVNSIKAGSLLEDLGVSRTATSSPSSTASRSTVRPRARACCTELTIQPSSWNVDVKRRDDREDGRARLVRDECTDSRPGEGPRDSRSESGRRLLRRRLLGAGCFASALALFAHPRCSRPGAGRPAPNGRGRLVSSTSRTSGAPDR